MAQLSTRSSRCPFPGTGSRVARVYDPALAQHGCLHPRPLLLAWARRRRTSPRRRRSSVRRPGGAAARRTASDRPGRASRSSTSARQPGARSPPRRPPPDRPARPCGRRAFPVNDAAHGVSVAPSTSPSTSTPLGPHSAHSDSARTRSKALVAAYGVSPRPPAQAAPDVTRRSPPRPRATIAPSEAIARLQHVVAIAHDHAARPHRDRGRAAAGSPGRHPRCRRAGRSRGRPVACSQLVDGSGRAEVERHHPRLAPASCAGELLQQGAPARDEDEVDAAAGQLDSERGARAVRCAGDHGPRPVLVRSCSCHAPLRARRRSAISGELSCNFPATLAGSVTIAEELS